MKKNQDRDYFPGTWGDDTPPAREDASVAKKGSRFSTGFWINLICVITVITILFTYQMTSAAKRKEYSQQLAAQQAIIDRLNGSDGSVGYDKLALLDSIFQNYAYYAGEVSQADLLTAVLKAYAQATGDRYAEYYTDEEYAALMEENEGNSVGVGISVVQSTLNVDGYEYQVFQVIAVYEDAPAAAAGVRVGDCVYAIKVDGEYRTVNALGYTGALSAMRGEKGTVAEFALFRLENQNYVSCEFAVSRDSFETQSVAYTVSTTDPSVGIVRINSFDLTTPSQFKKAISALQSQGIQRFVVDVRNNPGGDLQSIKAVLTYFLQEGDLILSSINRDGKVVSSYVAEPIEWTGQYEACNVSKEEIGMYADLDMVVLCNENTASAAEVFTATMRDYGLAPIVGATTFGKGIMQSYVALSSFGNYSGYLKFTTYAYVTKCGVTYHEIGVAPNVAVELSEEAKQYNLYVLPEALDAQLLTAIAQFQS